MRKPLAVDEWSLEVKMPVNLLNPAEFGFREGSPIFGYPPNARKAINEARMRIQGCQAYELFWDKVLTERERALFGNDVESCFQAAPISINLLCNMRGWIAERAIIEIAYRLNFLTVQDYHWLRELVGDRVSGDNDDSDSVNDSTPSWDHETGRLEFAGTICRNVRVARATTIVPILDQFQESDWPKNIEYLYGSEDPQRIHQAVANLNNKLNGIRFFVQGQQICWRPVSQ